MTLKTCSSKTCTQINPQPIDNFYKNKAKKGGRGGQCKVCMKGFRDKRTDRDNKEYQAEYRNKNRQRINEQNKVRAKLPETKLKNQARNYNLTVKQLQEMIDNQNGLCAICNSVCRTGKRLGVDHDRTCCSRFGSCGKCVRALLCSMCNRLIAWVREDKEVLMNSIKYLEKFERVKNPEYDA